MTAIYIQDGDAIDHLPVAALPAGSVVVQGHLVGITPRPIPGGGIGALQVEGVFDLPIVPGPIAGIGDQVFWDPTVGVATLDGTVAGVVYCGVAVLPLAATDAIIRVLLNHPR
jgi:predicted RecA/RadA family phage recombinase